MIVTISKDELYKRLGDLQGIAEKKTTIPILSNFLLEVSREKSTVYATDLEMAIGEPIEIIEIEKSGVICLPAKKIFEIAREVAGDIRIEGDDISWVKMKSGKSSYRIAALNPDEYPHWPSLDEKQSFNIHPEKLAGMLDRTIYCAGENDSRHTLNGVLFHIIGQKNEPKNGKTRLVMVGTNGHRLAVVSSDLQIDTEVKEAKAILPSLTGVPSDLQMDMEIKAILPRKAIMELRRLITGIEETIRFETAKNHIRFFVGEKVFLTKLIEGTYPNYEQVIPGNNNKSVLIDRGELIKTLRRVAVINRENSYVIRIDIEKGQMSASATSLEWGEAQDSLNVEYDGDSIMLGFNSRYLLEAIQSMKSQNIIMELLEALTPALVLEEGNSEYKCVLMPHSIAAAQ